MKSSMNLEPVRPTGMELVFMYRCPHCARDIPVPSPVSPDLTRCGICGNYFPIVPVDEQSLYFIKIILQNGLAAVDPDFF